MVPLCLNPGPPACKADVITATLQNQQPASLLPYSSSVVLSAQETLYMATPPLKADLKMKQSWRDRRGGRCTAAEILAKRTDWQTAGGGEDDGLTSMVTEINGCQQPSHGKHLRNLFPDRRDQSFISSTAKEGEEWAEAVVGALQGA